MPIDLNQLSPAPWDSSDPHGACCGSNCTPEGCHETHDCGEIELIGPPAYDSPLMFRNEADCQFAALARNAFAIMLKRNWWSVPGHADMWIVGSDRCDFRNDPQPDPFTALVEADRWYRKHVEKAGRPQPMTDRQAILENPHSYLIIGDLDKPFHLCECECGRCEDWRVANGRPTRAELRKMEPKQ